MMEAIRKDETPNFYFLHYELATWSVGNLLLIPHFAFPPCAIIKRNPTTPKGRSQPWIGCNIALPRIPADARIAVVKESTVTSRRSADAVPEGQTAGEIKAKERGWTLDVLTIVRRLVEERGVYAASTPELQSTLKRTEVRAPSEFATADVYAFERELEKLHPADRHVRDKIRQQLQVLRDMKLLVHVERGVWPLP